MARKKMKFLLTESVMLLEIIIMLLAINKTVRKGLYKIIGSVEMLQIFSGKCSDR